MKNTGQTSSFIESLNLFSIADINPSYSQYGEDMILLGLLQNEVNRDLFGFYVEVGLNKTGDYSTTKMFNRFYSWKGVNINSDAAVIADYESSRPYDVSIHSIVGQSGASLNQLLKDTVPDGTRIDLMCVGIEDSDLSILKTNDWKTYQPEFLAVECGDISNTTPRNNPIHDFIFSQGYHLVSQCVSTSIFQRG